MIDQYQQTYQIVAALVWKGDEMLLVRQQGPNDSAPSWALPGGRVESGELLTEALAREVREETGLEIMDPGKLAYVIQLDNTNQQGHEGAGPGNQSIAFIFEIGDWRGELLLADPDGLILEASFLPLPDAVRKLEELPFRVMREPILAYLSGECGPGSVWMYRREVDGTDNLVARLLGGRVACATLLPTI